MLLQVAKIGQNSFTINPKAVLELESTSRVPPPRMSASNQSAMGTSLPDGFSIHNGWPAGLQIWKEINGLPLSILKR
jgi:hypothetical protein